MDLFAICIAAVAATILAVTLKRYNPEISMLLAIGAGVIIFVLVLNQIPQALSQINTLLSRAGMPLQYGQVLFKALGICFLCQFSSDACKDAGQSALASKVELAGKLMIVLLALPMLEDIINTAVALMGAE
ncbi:MAG TPA: stage III sporulation protein AD [Candidatus Scatavimonas merdigallinarum]|uniref:Stage III sporulation protein AD n=1 Tax=Candidatus Scatavimonas merdigallinarum TaxID=2840914 RepID=A0A9D1CTL7_9FIRM|nr:stage III sporulation protein AD [Candidatus Scatavimonas merdigallinarum]